MLAVAMDHVFESQPCDDAIQFSMTQSMSDIIDRPGSPMVALWDKRTTALPLAERFRLDHILVLRFSPNYSQNCILQLPPGMRLRSSQAHLLSVRARVLSVSANAVNV